MYPAAASRSPGDDDPRPGPAASPRVDDRWTRSMHGRKYRNAAETCDLVFVNSEYTGRDVIESLGVSADRVRVARPAAKDVFRPDGSAAQLDAPYVLTVATLEPRKNLQTLVEAHRLLGGDVLLAVVGAEGWGEQPLLDGPRVPAARVRLRRGVGAPLPGCRGCCLPLALRGLRDPRDRGDGVRLPRRLVPPRVARRGERHCRPARRPDDPSAIAAAIELALGDRERLSRRRARARGASPGAPSARSSSAATRRPRDEKAEEV